MKGKLIQIVGNQEQPQNASQNDFLAQALRRKIIKLREKRIESYLFFIFIKLLIKTIIFIYFNFYLVNTVQYI
ncbi:unnamed protein product [Paramecium sonneborni]|uniref:Transmembrane protein n=1 Tax=Paramecium sonneborni TaxID=65129 RepID=A0A8S1KQY3_9CILI|nr:unnamed protein product [Paramecium sonneborni]